MGLPGVRVTGDQGKTTAAGGEEFPADQQQGSGNAAPSLQSSELGSYFQTTTNGQLGTTAGLGARAGVAQTGLAYKNKQEPR